MKVLITAPDLDETKQVGGIITVVKTIISVINVEHDIFVRSPAAGERNLLGKIKWLSKIIVYIKLCFSRDYDVIHIHSAMNRSALVRDSIWVFIGNLMGSRILLHFHGGKYLFESPPSKIVRALIKRVCLKSQAIIVLSEKEKESIIRLYQVTVPIYVLENAINTDLISDEILQFKKQWNPGSLKLIFIGRITESKGIHDIVQALIQLNSVTTKFKIDLYGEGDLKNYMLKELDPVLEGRIKYHGIVSGNAKWTALQQSDVFLLPSYGEGLPMALLEAMFLGNIVVTTNEGSMGLVVDNRVNGFIIDKHNPADMKNSLLEIINFTATQFEEMAYAAKSTVLRKYTASTYIKKLESIYANIAM